jgi:hypothetical protein
MPDDPWPKFDALVRQLDGEWFRLRTAQGGGASGPFETVRLVGSRLTRFGLRPPRESQGAEVRITPSPAQKLRLGVTEPHQNRGPHCDKGPRCWRLGDNVANAVHVAEVQAHTLRLLQGL